MLCLAPDFLEPDRTLLWSCGNGGLEHPSNLPKNTASDEKTRILRPGLLAPNSILFKSKNIYCDAYQVPSIC